MVIIIVTFVMIVMGLATVDVQLGLGTDAQQHADRQAATTGFNHLDGWRQLFGDFGAHRSQPFGVKHVGFIEDHQIGAGQLIGEQLVQRRLVVQIRVQFALCIDLIRECGERTGDRKSVV